MALALWNETIDWRNFKLSLEAQLLGGLAVLDMLSTLYLMECGVVVEANPVLAPYAAISPLAFAFAKLMMTIPQLVLLEVIARKYPQTVRRYGRLGIIAYALVYIAGGLLLNHR